MLSRRDLRFETKVKPEALKQFLLSLSSETLHTFNHFGTEINQSNVDTIVQKELTRADKLRFFLTAGDGQIISYGFLTLFEKPAKKHNCILGLVVSDDWQNKGYGKAMCMHMIKQAWEAGLKKIWLNVYADNPQASRLYRAAGFEVEGVFMADEEVEVGDERHVVSMAIFRDRHFGKAERLKIWSSVEGQD